ncbi:MAG TPA: CPBP family intramembrane glutamic endopeptidase [Thermoanaerobaculia bacterium]|nr:CPBP family intramembrane glutamic endopeptidase [Thermoanaerobaculia bacterium]
MTEPSPRPRVLFDRRDRVFIALCVLTILAGAAVFQAGFSRAFPEASIDFKVTREEAVRRGAEALRARGFALDGMRPLVIFDGDDEAKVYLERTLGLEKANPIFATTVPVWRWSVRWVRPLEKLEYRAAVAPDGRLLAVRRILPEKAAAPDPGEAAARALAEAEIRTLRGLEPSALRFIETTVNKRPERVDRVFVWESNAIRFGDAALRYLVEVQGDRVGRSSLHFEVPERWRRDYETLRSKNLAAGTVATLGLLLTALAVLVVFLERVRRKDVKWKWALAFAGTGAVLQLFASLNEMPIRLFDYDTADAWTGFVAKSVAGDVGGAIALGVVLLLLVAAGEPLYRERYPDKPALGRLLSRRGISSKRFFRGLLLGYAMTAFFFAYQIVFYLVAARFGAWAPADVPYSNLLGTWFPWAGVLLMGFLPATTEEFSSRMFSIPFAERFLPRWAAVVVPALIWGFAHSTYPNQPFYIRGLEVGFAGILIGAVMLKADIFPLLVWHFTVDAVYTALLLLRSSNPYFVVSGAAASLILLLPLAVSVALYFRRGGFTPDEDLTNAATGSAPAPPHVEEAVPSVCAPPRALNAGHVLSALVLALLAFAAARFVLPRAGVWENVSVKVDRIGAKAAADAYLKAAGDDPAGYLSVATTATALPGLEDPSDTGTSLVPYGDSELGERWLLERGGTPLLTKWATTIFPGPVWNVRYVRALDEHGATVAVDARTGRIAGFRRTFPEAEAGGSPDESVARSKAASVVASFGLDPAAWDVVSAKSEARKARRDTHVVSESRLERAGEATLRAVTGLAGDVPSLFATALKLPEEWVRAREKSTAATYVAIVWKILAWGTLVGLVVVELVRLARAGSISWRRSLRLGAVLAIPAILSRFVSLPLVLARYDSQFSMAVFAVVAGVGLLVGILVSFGAALLAVILVLAVKRDAAAAFRPGGADGPRALAAGAGAAAFILSIRALARGLEAAFPLEAGVAGFPFPTGVETVLPAAVAIGSLVLRMLLFACVAAFLALLLRDALKKLVFRVAFFVVAIGVFAPFGARTFGELLVPVFVGALTVLAFLAAIAIFLRDDPRAYAFAAAFLGAAGAGADLVSSGIAPWVWNGVIVLAFVALLVVRFGLDRPRQAPLAA